MIALLTEKGIGSSVHYRPLHQHDLLATAERATTSARFPVADRYFDGAMTLPLYPGMRASRGDEVVSVLREALG